MSHFTRFAAIDWSGAKGTRHPGIALAVCDLGQRAPQLVAAPHRAWSRAEILDWVLDHAAEPMLIGFDFSFAPPIIQRGSYLPGEETPTTARAFWAYVDALCDDADLGAAHFLEERRGVHFYLGAADGAKGDFVYFRRCEIQCNLSGVVKASSVYDAIGAAQVAKASFAGMRLLHRLSGHVPVWPFDSVPESGALVVEIYTTIAARQAGVRKGRSKLRDGLALDTALAQLGSDPHELLAHYGDHATDAILAAAWLRSRGNRAHLWAPSSLTSKIAECEGWTFGVT